MKSHVRSAMPVMHLLLVAAVFLLNPVAPVRADGFDCNPNNCPSFLECPMPTFCNAGTLSCTLCSMWQSCSCPSEDCTDDLGNGYCAIIPE